MYHGYLGLIQFYQDDTHYDRNGYGQADNQYDRNGDDQDVNRIIDMDMIIKMIINILDIDMEKTSILW